MIYAVNLIKFCGSGELDHVFFFYCSIILICSPDVDVDLSSGLIAWLCVYIKHHVIKVVSSVTSSLDCDFMQIRTLHLHTSKCERI